MHKQLLGLVLTIALIGYPLVHVSMLAKAATSVSFDPATVSVNPGDSVSGDGQLMCGLVIGNSGNNPVTYIQAGQQPAAYGANNSDTDLNSAINGYLPQGFGIADLGDGSDVMSKQHLYDFSFSSAATVNTFTIGVVDWGDYLPNAQGMAGHHEMILTAYDSANAVVNSQNLAFDTDYSDKAVNRISPQYGEMIKAGDAGQATPGQPGNFSLTVSGLGISRVELRYADAISTDPNIAISNISYTLEDGDVATRCAPAPTPTPSSTPSPTQSGSTSSTTTDSSNQGGVQSTSTTTTGSVLGASTLADTGTNEATLVSLVFALGSALAALGLNLRFKK